MLHCARGLLQYNGCCSVSPTSTVSRDGGGGGGERERERPGEWVVSHRVDCCVYFIGAASIRRKKNLASSDGVLLSWSCVFMTVESESKNKTKQKRGNYTALLFLFFFYCS